MSDWVDVASAADIAPGTSRSIEVDGTMIAVFNLDGEYYAIEDVCTHDGGILTGGKVEGDQVVCPRHGSQFELATGVPRSLPATEPVPTYPVRVVDGKVVVELP